MSEVSLSGLLSSGDLADLNPRDTITQIKAAAIRQFEALDTRVRIHSTEYFNHSFAPDLVLRWTLGGESERYVYMRSHAQGDALSEDIIRLGDQRPIVLDLVPIRFEGTPSASANLNRIAQEKDTLVTDANALKSIAVAKKEQPIASLFSSALAQGGRGLVDDDDARRTTVMIADGFVGAQDIKTESVQRAAVTVDGHLSPPFANRFNRLLQAVWIGSGGRAEMFPHKQTELSAGVDDDALEFLLELDPIEDFDFWKRVGRATSVTQIGKLPAQQRGRNLQFLIKANLDLLKARACRVQYRQQQLDESDQPLLWWSIERRSLALCSHTWIAFVAEKSDDLNHIEGSPTEGVSIPDLQERARNTILIGLQMSDGTYELDLSSPAHADVAHSDRLSAVTQSFGTGTKVQRARVMSGGRQIACDFTKSSASTTTSSVLTMAELLGVSLPLLRQMSDELRSELEDLLKPLEGQSELPFDQLPTGLALRPEILSITDGNEHVVEPEAESDDS